MATLCCDAVAEGLRTVPPTSLTDLREGFNMQRTMLHMVLKLHHRITTGLVTTNGPALGQSLGPSALEVVIAGFEATMRLQEAVLCPDALACTCTCYVRQLPKFRPIIPLSSMCDIISRARHWSHVQRSALCSFASLHICSCSTCNKPGTRSNIMDAVMLSIRRGRTGGPHRVDSARWR